MSGEVLNSYSDFSVKIKLSSNVSHKDIEILVSANSTVAELISKIRVQVHSILQSQSTSTSPSSQPGAHSVSNPNSIKVRLIFSGKILQPETSTLSAFNVGPGAFIHAVINLDQAARPASSPAAPSLPSSLAATAVTPVEERGFDRLLQDLSIDEVYALRASLRDFVDRHGENVPQLPDETPGAYRARLEDSWMSTPDGYGLIMVNVPREAMFRLLGFRGQVNTPSTGTGTGTGLAAMAASRGGGGGVGGGVGGVLSRLINRDGTADDTGADTDNDTAADHYDAASQDGNRFDFLWGFAMGLMLGFLASFCLWDRNINKSHKMGIFLGILTSMIIGMNVEPSKSDRHSGSSGSGSGSGSGSSGLRGTRDGGVRGGGGGGGEGGGLNGGVLGSNVTPINAVASMPNVL